MAEKIFSKILKRLKLLFCPCHENKYKPRFLDSKFLFYYALFLLFLKLIVLPFLFYFPQTAFFADITRSNLIEFTNKARLNLGLSVLQENVELNKAAYLKAQDMLNKGYFAHYSPEGISPWYWLAQSGYYYRAAGENLAIGFLESEQVHYAWMNSPSHKENILNPAYQEIGIAVVKGNFQGHETTLVVQFLGAPRIPLRPEPEIIQTAEELPVPIIEEPPEEEPKEITERVAAEEEIQEEPTEPTEPTEKPVSEEEVSEKEPVEDREEEALIEEEDPTEEKEELPVLIAEQRDPEKTPLFFLFNFMTSDYYNWLQRIIYGSLVLIIISLLITIYCDIFIYRKFVFDHKDVIFKTIGYAALWFILVYVDKMIMLELITYNFRIN